MIREAKQTDIPELITLAIEALNADKYSEFTIDRNRVFMQVSSCVISKMNFSWVSEIDGKIVGGLGAAVTPQAVYEGSIAVVVMWYCKTGGDGMRLMREFLRWVDARKSINQVQYTGERKGDIRILQSLVKRYGFIIDVPFLYRNR